MRWVRRLLWRPFAITCRLIPLVPLTVTQLEVDTGIVQLRPENWVVRLLGRIGGYPYAAMYVIDGEVMIDSGFPWARRALRRHLQESGLAESIHTLLITHEHEDHFGNNDMIAEVTGASVHAHPSAIAEIAFPYEGAWYRNFLFGPVGPSAVAPSPSSVATSRRTLAILHTPGHTPGHTVVFDRLSGTLFAGDLFLDAELDSQLADAHGPTWLQSLDDVNRLPIERLADGHGLVLDGEAARQALRSKAEFLRALRDAVAHELAKGPRTVQDVTRAIATPGPINRVSFGEGRMSMLTRNDFSRSNLVRTFIHDLAVPRPDNCSADGGGGGG